MNRNILIYFFLLPLIQTLGYAQNYTVATSYANVLYREISNHIHITVQGYSCDSLLIRTNNGNVLQIDSSCNIYIRPSAEDAFTLRLSISTIKNKDTIVIGEKIFDVVNVPPMKAGINRKQTGKISKKVLLGHSRIILYPPLNASSSFAIERFSILIIRNDEILFFGHFKQQYFDKEIYKIFAKLKSGDIILFFNIFASNSYNLPYLQIEPIEFIIEE